MPSARVTNLIFAEIDFFSPAAKYTILFYQTFSQCSEELRVFRWYPELTLYEKITIYLKKIITYKKVFFLIAWIKWHRQIAKKFWEQCRKISQNVRVEFFREIFRDFHGNIFIRVTLHRSHVDFEFVITRRWLWLILLITCCYSLNNNIRFIDRYYYSSSKYFLVNLAIVFE